LLCVIMRHVHFTTPDGLTLYAGDHGPTGAARTPLLCLPGLTRNSKDFAPLLAWLPQDRRVICPDYRGRGRSQHAADPLTYTPPQELADIITLLDHLGVGRAAVIGTSRGGIIAMLMAAFHRGRMAGALLNDIGPRIEAAGLLRIRTNIDGPAPQPGSWDEAVAHLKARDPGYETLPEAEWLAMARRIFAEEEGRPLTDFDPGLARTFPSAAEIEGGKVPELWTFFGAMLDMPVSVLRGEKSDLLSADIVAEMAAQMPGLKTAVVPDRGHIPFLDEPVSRAAITAWLADIDGD
jgi:pimeloyl-ACP methyl ester carboxylesterase